VRDAAGLLWEEAARDGVENAIEKVNGLGSGVAAADLESLVNDDRKRRPFEAQQFGDSHAQQIAIDGGHAIDTPVRGVSADERVDFFLLGLRHAKEIFSEASHFWLDGIAGFPECGLDLVGRLAADIGLEEHLHGKLAGLAPPGGVMLA
jgi:hypothetical protein